MVKYFEPIKVSAIHIYHSALELCPTSSIVRSLYYEQCNRIAYSPRVVVGTPDSWDKAASVSICDDNYWNCVWSPCSQFIATHTGKVIEIRNQLTLEVSTTLQPTETTLKPMGRLAYSPDGHFLACASNGFILIWDIQTGGVVREIECGSYLVSLAWSLNGRTVGVIDWPGGDKARTWTSGYEAWRANVITYDLTSGRQLFSGPLYPRSTLCLSESVELHLWAHEESFRTIHMRKHSYFDGGGLVEVDIFEVNHALVNIRSFSLTSTGCSYPDISLSPTTCRIAISDENVLHIFENWNSTCMLEEMGWFTYHNFSSDGSLFAAFKHPNVVHIWKYGSLHFLPWKKFTFMDILTSLQFSPDLLSFMQCSGTTLNVWRLHDLPLLPTTSRSPQAGLTCSGQIVQASGNFITIVNPHSRPSRVAVVDAGAEIQAFILTGNVLLVAAEWIITAWLVPPAGFVDGCRLVDRGDALWVIQVSDPWVGVAGKVGFIHTDLGPHIFYHTETGEVLNLDYSTTTFWGRFLTRHFDGDDYRHFHNLPQSHALPQSCWETSRGGWVKDSEGRCRFWLPVDWRREWRVEDLRYDVTTQFSIIGGKVVIVKF